MAKSTFWQDFFGYEGDPVTAQWDKESDELWDPILKKRKARNG